MEQQGCFKRRVCCFGVGAGVCICQDKPVVETMTSGRRPAGKPDCLAICAMSASIFASTSGSNIPAEIQMTKSRVRQRAAECEKGRPGISAEENQGHITRRMTRQEQENKRKGRHPQGAWQELTVAPAEANCHVVEVVMKDWKLQFRPARRQPRGIVILLPLHAVLAAVRFLDQELLTPLNHQPLHAPHGLMSARTIQHMHVPALVTTGGTRCAE